MGAIVTDEELAAAVEAYQRLGGKQAAADELGIPTSTLKYRLNMAKRQRLSRVADIIPGFEVARISQTMDENGNVVRSSVTQRPAPEGGFSVPPGHVIKGVSTLVDAEGRVQAQWFKTREGMATEDMIEAIKTAFADLQPIGPTPAPEHHDEDLLTVYPIADAHLGMMSWGRETGEDYDTNIASDRLRRWIGMTVDASPASAEAVILDVGDLTHADDQTNQTPTSKHSLDVDTRHFRTLEVAISALAYATEYALTKHARVIVRILPGNHNLTSYMAVMFALAERYRHEPRVVVQKVPGEFWVHRFGDCFLAAHHGDKAKAERIVMFLADEYAALWGQTKHRFLWTGHLHHHKSADIGGVQWEQLRAVTARDAYATSHAYAARSQLQAITLHRTRGEIMRVKVGV